MLSTERVGIDAFREATGLGRKWLVLMEDSGLSSADLYDKGSKFAEIMNLFFYHIYRKLAREEYQRLRDAPRRPKSRRLSAHPG